MSNPSKDLLRGTLEMIVLSLLADKESYGYEIISTVKDMSAGSITLKEGSLYPVLYRLEDGKLIESFWQAEGRGNPRKYYKLTELGIKELKEQIADWKTYTNQINNIIDRSSTNG